MEDILTAPHVRRILKQCCSCSGYIPMLVKSGEIYGKTSSGFVLHVENVADVLMTLFF